MLCIPEGWWHTAESQSVSITVSGNWVERSNWDDFFESFLLRAPTLTEDERGGLHTIRKLVAVDYQARRPW